MTALATIEPTAIAETPFQAWLAMGRQLLQDRNRVEWQLADWLANGRQRAEDKELGFGDQASFDFLGDALGIAPKDLKSAVKVALAFPPHMRDASLTFQHHEAVATLPTVEALEVLKRARVDHLDDRETRVEAVKRRVEIGQTTLLPDDDWDHHALMAITRAWNRAPAHVREEFIQLAEEANGSVIDA